MDDFQRRHAENIIGHRFQNPELLSRALTHASTAGTRLDSNERLEFLGDAVLGLVVCEMIYRRFPHFLEGEMTKVKSLAVSRQTCAQIASRLGLERLLMLGKGMQTSAPLPASLGAAALESVIGALYLDAGFDAAAAFIRPLVSDVIDRAAASGHQQNYKSVLQQFVQQKFGMTPVYRIVSEDGPDHAKTFVIAVEIGATIFEGCKGQSKKRAEQDAALTALTTLGVVAIDGPDDEPRVIDRVDEAHAKAILSRGGVVRSAPPAPTSRTTSVRASAAASSHAPAPIDAQAHSDHAGTSADL
jgi:ribonuclease-3